MKRSLRTLIKADSLLLHRVAGADPGVGAGNRHRFLYELLSGAVHGRGRRD